jgi:hypothetical protein
MANLAEFTFAPPNFWPGAAVPEESSKDRSDILRRRYEVLLSVLHGHATARPEDLVTCFAAQLRHVVDFDVFDSIVNREADPAFVGADRTAYLWESQDSAQEQYLDEVDEVTGSWKFAKVIEFYKLRDWKPKREWVPAGQHAEVIMFPTTNKKSA